MITVPQFNSPPHLQGMVLYGKPVNQYLVEAGTVAVFADDAPVLYQLRTKRLQTFLFHGRGTTTVPGVRPRVNLIAYANTATDSLRLTNTLFWLADHGYAPETLSEALWQRVSDLLNKERYNDQDLCILLH